METGEEVLRLGKLSDQELLAGLSGVLGSGRKVLALLVAHLGEVEERRLHLLAGYGSMFAYCTNRLGMSEDEAYRRIEVARLARRFPVLLERLATGRISLSVAALLKMHLSEVNHVALLDAVAGKTVKIAREVLAAWFPRPDVLASIRRLPERQASGGDAGANAGVLFNAPSLAGGGKHSVQKEASASESAFESASVDCTAAPGAGGQRAAVIGPLASRIEALAASRARDAGRVQPGLGDARGGARTGSAPLDEAAGGFSMRRDTNIAPRCAGPAVRIGAHVAASGSLFAEEPTAIPPAPAVHPAPLTGMRAPRRASLELEPLSPGRYKIVFTADADLKQKLDLARDLLRHAEPHGELAAIIGRGLDLLIERTLQRRFGTATRLRAHSSAARGGATPHVATAMAVPTAEYVDPERVASDDDVPAVSKAAPGAAPAANEPVPSAGAPNIADIAPTPIPNDDASVTGGLAPSRETDAAQRPPSAPPAPAPQTQSSRHLPSATRRAVLERDGLRCTWVGPDGVRCESRAWLEHDHIVPRGLGGSDDPSNIRIRCRPHNHLAAEQAYGEPAIARIIARRRAREDPGHIADANPGEGEA